ncbi:putative serine/threonine protein kinase [Blattamonas nauphoetae]|uniref:Serine/threonine protein kinase n=1 Tax=Blattamonas nauphoetae TaxID=2049346 RepID=A0ABQ9XI14_9EUKA|nr:putative serine/threonine protein kinase [Blattamonas nauphoetae]
MTYLGEHLNSIPHGEGTLHYENGDVYTGSFQNGERHGYGVYSYQTGRVYQGEWSHNRFHGHGLLILTNGYKFEGRFENGVMSGSMRVTAPNEDEYVGEISDLKFHGRGVFKRKEDNAVYEGSWVNHKSHGFGTFTFFDEAGNVIEQYSGDWVEGRKCGQGTMSSITGKKYTGTWKNDNYHGEGTLNYQNGNTYTGSFSNGNREGYGTLVYSDGRRYEGNWVMNNAEGFGRFTYLSGDVYEGEWKHTRKHGKGRLRYANGDQYEGDWVNGEATGNGIYLFSNGDIFTGSFVDGLPDGQGTLTTRDGTRFSGTWNGLVGWGTVALARPHSVPLCQVKWRRKEDGVIYFVQMEGSNAGKVMKIGEQNVMAGRSPRARASHKKGKKRKAVKHGKTKIRAELAKIEEEMRKIQQENLEENDEVGIEEEPKVKTMKKAKTKQKPLVDLQNPGVDEPVEKKEDQQPPAVDQDQSEPKTLSDVKELKADLPSVSGLHTANDEEQKLQNKAEQSDLVVQDTDNPNQPVNLTELTEQVDNATVHPQGDPKNAKSAEIKEVDPKMEADHKKDTLEVKSENSTTHESSAEDESEEEDSSDDFPIDPDTSSDIDISEESLVVKEKIYRTAKYQLNPSCQIDGRLLRHGKKIGHGGFGDVYLGFFGQRQVAWKQLQSDVEEEGLEEFRREAAIMSHFHHRNVVFFYGYTSPPDIRIVMEYANHGSLHHFIHDLHNKIPLTLLFDIADQAARGLLYLHQQHAIHKDLKPLNMLLTLDPPTNSNPSPTLRVMISDFGLSKLKTHTKTFLPRKGTLAYTAPECFNNDPCNEKVDVFSFGIVMWEILVRDIPFKQLHAQRVISEICEGRRPRLPTIPAHLAPLLQPYQELMVRCWDENPDLRPNMSEVCSILGQLKEMAIQREKDSRAKKQRRQLEREARKQVKMTLPVSVQPITSVPV